MTQPVLAGPMDSYAESFRNFSAWAGGDAPSWVGTARHAAFERFVALGFPTTRNEDWHFTSVAPIAEHGFDLLTSAGGNVDRSCLAPFTFGASEWYTIVFINGRHAPELSTLQGLPPGVRVLDLPTAWHDAPGVVEKIGKIAGYDDQAFTALNTAFMYDGAVVDIRKDVVVERPIHLLFVTDANLAEGVAHPRNLIVAGRHSRATVIESYVSITDAMYFTNAVTETSVAEGATLTHYKIQREGIHAFHVGTIDARQARDSHYVSFSFSTGGSLTRTNVSTALDGEGCGATLNGLYMLDEDQHCDHQTQIVHAQPNCYSRELYKGVLDGRSHGVFNGKVYVHPAAQKTDGKQTNNTLLLSERAQVDTKPQLEIFADDVKCTHGATVGRLDEMALFYMKSRGLNATTARELLTYAFAADVLETLEVAAVREGLERMTLRRFTKAREIAG